MSLEALQSEFAKALLDPSLPVPSCVDGTKQIDAGRRFAIYRNNVVASLIDALKTAFPAVVRVVGEEFFDAMAGIYVRNHPPASPVMMLYGDRFPEFLTDFGPVAELAYLPDIARLEQIRREIYHAADAQPLPADFLAHVPEEKLADLVFSCHPAVVATAFDYPVLSLWEWNMSGSEEQTPDFPHHGEEVLFYREEADIKARRLSPGGALFFTSLIQGLPFGTSAENASEIAGFDLADSVAALLEARLVVAIT